LMFHQPNAPLECLFIPNARLLDISHAVIDYSQIKVRFLKLVFEYWANLWVLGLEALTGHCNEILLHTILIPNKCLIIIFNLHKNTGQIKIGLDIILIITQGLLINIPYLWQNVHGQGILPELPDLRLIRVLRHKEVSGWFLCFLQGFMFESDAIGDAVPGVDYNSIILLIRWQMLVCINLLAENGFVNLFRLFIFALLEK
jgi:hypothetical protein